ERVRALERGLLVERRAPEELGGGGRVGGRGILLVDRARVVARGRSGGRALRPARRRRRRRGGRLLAPVPVPVPRPVAGARLRPRVGGGLTVRLRPRPGPGERPLRARR